MGDKGQASSRIICRSEQRAWPRPRTFRHPTSLWSVLVQTHGFNTEGYWYSVYIDHLPQPYWIHVLDLRWKTLAVLLGLLKGFDSVKQSTSKAWTLRFLITLATRWPLEWLCVRSLKLVDWDVHEMMIKLYFSVLGVQAMTVFIYLLSVFRSTWILIYVYQVCNLMENQSINVLFSFL